MKIIRKIRSTETIATSNKFGKCDILRELLYFGYNLELGFFEIIIRDTLFQEQTIDVMYDDKGFETDTKRTITERVIREVHPKETSNFSFKEIKELFNAYGVTISKKSNFVEKLNENLDIMFLYQTKALKIQTMTNWIEDTEHQIVTEFSK